MRYSYEYKLKCIEMYKQGIYPETPEGINTKWFHKTIRKWYRIEEAQGPDALRHKGINKVWIPEEKLDLVSKVLDGKSIKSTAIEAGINHGMLYQWVHKYKIYGYNGLVDKRRGRKAKESSKMKKDIKPDPLTESEREELIHLRAENEYIKAENAVIKKEIALREKNELHNSRRKSSDYQRTLGKRISAKVSFKSYGDSQIHLLLRDKER